MASSRRDNPNLENIEATLVQWQRPLYNLALRMLGNEADAADATQEIFATVIRNLRRFDRSREFKPWVYRVATHEIYKFIRKTKGRAARENVDSMNIAGTAGETPPEDRELEGMIRDQVARLPEDARAALVLHYYNGLTQTEVASALAVPRTTVQSRIRKGLDLVRRGLRSTGFPAATVGHLERVLTSTASVEVPAVLQASLMKMVLGASGSQGATAAAWTIGGILMKKGVILTGLGIFVVSLGLGFGLGGIGSGGGSGDRGEAAGHGGGAGGSATESEFARLRSEHQAALRRLAALERENAEWIARAGDAAGPDGDGASGGPVAGAASAFPSSRASGIDWSRFREIFAANLDRLLAHRNADERGEAPNLTAMSQEDQARFLQFTAEAMRIGAAAREISDHPLLDDRILFEFTEAVLADSLELGDSQLSRLSELCGSVLRRSLGDVDFETLSPLEAVQARRAVIAGLTESVGSILDEGQVERWGEIAKITVPMMKGTPRVRSVGFEGADDPQIVVSFWEDSLRLTEEQASSPSVQNIASSYLYEAKLLLETYDQFSETPTKLYTQDSIRLENELLSLQIRMQSQLEAYLTPSQIESIQSTDPWILEFHFGTDVSESVSLGSIF